MANSDAGSGLDNRIDDQNLLTIKGSARLTWADLQTGDQSVVILEASSVILHTIHRLLAVADWRN